MQAVIVANLQKGDNGAADEIKAAGAQVDVFRSVREVRRLTGFYVDCRCRKVCRRHGALR